MIYTPYIKRFLDLITAMVLLILFSWLFIFILLAYLLSWNLPILFRQARIGKNGIPFMMWKFRTLSVQEARPLQERRFALGNLLRSTNLDELAQLWNVLTGDMSFIGPRPLPMEYLPLMNEQQRTRHRLRPGITGWAQVNGRHTISWERKFELDRFYIHHVSFALDLKILVKTIILFASFRKDNSLSEEKFSGRE
jgi:undecaprenyl phosphate N,N'-diacetylbacillosamine 1-phosphate transferase